MTVPLRSAADLARALGVVRQRLNPYVRRAGVEPVARSGARLLYDEAGQRAIVEQYHEGVLRDAGRDWREQYEEGLRLYRLAHELGLLEEWLADPWLRFLVRREDAERLLAASAKALAAHAGLTRRARIREDSVGT